MEARKNGIRKSTSRQTLLRSGQSGMTKLPKAASPLEWGRTNRTNASFMRYEEQVLGSLKQQMRQHSAVFCRLSNECSTLYSILPIRTRQVNKNMMSTSKQMASAFSLKYRLSLFGEWPNAACCASVTCPHLYARWHSPCLVRCFV